jgi:hypothetical protein
MSSNASNTLLVGPVIGNITDTTARILFEVQYACVLRVSLWRVLPVGKALVRPQALVYPEPPEDTNLGARQRCNYCKILRSNCMCSM